MHDFLLTVHAHKIYRVHVQMEAVAETTSLIASVRVQLQRSHSVQMLLPYY